MAYKAGDIVQLKSGGPKMTVTGISQFGEGHTETTWFAGSKLEHGAFPESALRPVSPDEDKKEKK